MNDNISALRAALRDIPDFPKPGILFKDITPLLSDGALLRACMEELAATMAGQEIHKVAAIDARGFIFAGAIAERLGVGLVLIRKKGKLPYKTVAVSYDLEYGSNTVEIHEDAIKPGERVWLVDDVLATGGTAAAAVELVSQLGGTLIGLSFLVELSFLEGRKHLPLGIPVHSVLHY